MKWSTWIGVLSLSFLCSCKALDLERGEFNSRINEPIVDYEEEMDVIYGRTRYQSFDIHYPKNVYDTPADVVIMVHGGGWVYGDKWFLQPSVDELRKARKNLAIVNINYRLIAEDPRKTLFEHQIEDLDSCLSFLMKNVTRFNIRSDKFAIMGASAGAHLSLSYAYTLGKEKIHTVVGMSSITEFTAPELVSSDLWNGIKVVSGYDEGDADKGELLKASPVHLAGFDSPRTILLYGLKDDLIKLRQQTLLRERLLALRVPNALYILKDQDHNIAAEHVAESILASLGADEYDLYFERD